jgi:hypothetical protein
LLTGLPVESDQRARQACSRAIEKEAHPQSFGTLHGGEAKLTPDVILVDQKLKLSFVEVRTLLKPRDPLFDAAPKARTDFESLVRGRVLDHD